MVTAGHMVQLYFWRKFVATGQIARKVTKIFYGLNCSSRSLMNLIKIIAVE